jgi:hypothetical protein
MIKRIGLALVAAILTVPLAGTAAHAADTSSTAAAAVVSCSGITIIAGEGSNYDHDLWTVAVYRHHVPTYRVFAGRVTAHVRVPHDGRRHRIVISLAEWGTATRVIATRTPRCY